MSETPTDKMEETSSEAFIGRVYRISSPDTDQIYVGSTRKELKTRLVKHKSDMKRWQKGQCNYISSFEILNYDNADIDIIEEDEFIDKQHMREREKYWIQKLNCVNKIRPCKTREEHIADRRMYERKQYHENLEKSREKTRSSKAVKKPCPHCKKIMCRGSIWTHIKNKHALTEENK
jgi:hypothetical protein